MSTPFHITKEFFYQDNYTGELLTLKEMIKAGRNDYGLEPANHDDFHRWPELFTLTDIQTAGHD